MKQLVSLFFLLSIFLVSHSQTPIQLKLGEELQFRRNAEFNELVGISDGKIFMLSCSAFRPQNSIDVNLDMYDVENLGFIGGISVIGNKSDRNFEKAVLAGEKIMVFTSYYDRELGLKVLVMQEFDDTRQVLGEDQRVDEVATYAKDDVTTFEITTSPDGNYILIYHDNPSESGNKVFNLKVINYDLTSMWEKELILNYKAKMIEFTQILLDNGSNVYLLSSINPFGINRNSGLGAMVNIKSTLFTYRPYEDKLKEYEFTLSKNWIDEVKMVIDAQGKLLATAYFTYPNDYKIRGFVMFELNTSSGQVEAKKMATLSKEDFKEVDESIGRLKEYSRMLVGNIGIYPGSSSHMNNSSTEFIMKDVFIMNDAVVVAVEAFRRDERCTESFSDQQMIVDCQKNFLYGDVMLFFLDKNCEIKSIRHVQKLQHNVNKLNPYYSFSLVGNNDGFFVLYNDDYRNQTEEQGLLKTPLSNMNKSILSISGFNAMGNEMDLSFTMTEEDRIPFFPYGNALISSSDILLYFQKEKNYKFGKLSLR
jgi:hypothetical protein